MSKWGHEIERGDLVINDEGELRQVVRVGRILEDNPDPHSYLKFIAVPALKLRPCGTKKSRWCKAKIWRKASPLEMLGATFE